MQTWLVICMEIMSSLCTYVVRHQKGLCLHVVKQGAIQTDHLDTVLVWRHLTTQLHAKVWTEQSTNWCAGGALFACTA